MSNTENILQTLKTTVQDVVAPDVRELKVRLSSLEDQMKVQFDALQRQSDAQFKAIMAAMNQNKAESELSSFRTLADVKERLAVLEAKRQ